jgi:FkbM family methyltransferase
MLQRLKRMVTGTPLEPLARRAYRLLRSPPQPNPDNDDIPLVRMLAGRLPADTNTVDVGANKGQVLGFVVSAFPGGQHFAFEAIPELCDELRARFSKAVIQNLAVTDRAGSVTFNHVITNSGFSGIERRLDLREEDKVVTIEVQAGRLDDFVPVGTKIGFLKIDVEGGELGVLRGAARILRDYHPVILFEHGKGAAPLYGTAPGDVYQLLHELGYSITTIPGAIAGEPGLSADAFRATFEAGRFFMFVAQCERHP